MRIAGVLVILASLVFLAGPWLVGPPGSRAHAHGDSVGKARLLLMGVVGLVAGLLMLTGG